MSELTRAVWELTRAVRELSEERSPSEDQVEEVRHAARLRKWLCRKLGENGPMTVGALRQAAASRDRPWVVAALREAEGRKLVRLNVAGKWELVW